MIEFFTENAEYLLDRPIRTVADKKTAQFFRGKCVLVTGGGGTIGSQLAVEAAKCGAEKLVILDVNENNAHETVMRLKSEVPAADVRVVIASVRDRQRMFEVFGKISPDAVFHTAAHKHVSLMEDAPAEAVKNNVFGTVNTVDAAEAAGVSSFVFISSDKAVEPVGVMGATKRLGELIVSSRRDSKTVFSAVRFGNVLGSSGSVMPDFYRRIKRGEVLEITHPQAERYFMSVKEAAELVLSAAADSRRGIKVLNMGRAVNITAIAKRLGDIMSRDVRIEYTALGQGEKLNERLLYADDCDFGGELIFSESDCGVSREYTAAAVKKLSDLLGDETALKAALLAVVKI